MNPIINTTDASSSTTCSDLSSNDLALSMDCSPFLNWEEDEDETFPEKTVVLRSLVTTLKLQPTLDDSLEAKAVTFLESVELYDEESAETLLSSLSSPSDKSLTECVQSIVVLLSTSNQAITTASMKILQRLIQHCSETNTLTIVKADLIPQLINTLNMLSLPFAEAEDIHHCFLSVFFNSFCCISPNDLAELEIEDPDEQQAIYEMVLKQVLAPSEQYLCRLCQNRCSMIDSELSERFLPLFAQLLEVCPYYQPTMDFVQNLPIFFTIPSCLTIFEDDFSTEPFFNTIRRSQKEWNEKGGNLCRPWTLLVRSLSMEGIEDVIEEKMRTNRKRSIGRGIVKFSIEWNNLQGMNLTL